MRRVALKIAYIGTEFHGYQRQPNFRTVEGELLNVFQDMQIIEDTWKAHYSVAGRTDKGVHSTGNVISFITDSDIYINEINGLLPDDIKIIGEARVPYGFKVRFPIDRTYTYVQPINPFKEDIDIELMKEALPLFIGEHNFRNFSKKNEKNPNRVIMDVKLEEKGNLLIFTVTGRSFLWNMVRKMITAIMKIGYHELEVDTINTLLQPVDLRTTIRLRPAPANGLILSGMNYKNIKFKDCDYAKDKMRQTLLEKYLDNMQKMETDNVLMNLLE